MCSGETWESLKVSPLIEHEAPQKVKAKVKLPNVGLNIERMTQHKTDPFSKDWETH